MTCFLPPGQQRVMRPSAISVTMTLPSSITTGASGKRNPSAISSNSAILVSLACPHLLCFAAIMPVRTLFATNFYEADIGTPDLLDALEESCRLFAEEDGAGRAWSREHGYKGYTSYASLDDLPERDPAFYDLKKRSTKR